MSNWTYDPKYRLTSPFGMRMHPKLHVNKFHRGVDLVVTPGNGPLHAFVAGTVLYAKLGVPGIGIPAEMGIVVAIKDNKGCLHIYAHLSAAIVKVGDKVTKGQMIGKQGTTGASTGNHLHYEVRKAAAPLYGWTATEAGVVEPTQYLQDYYKAVAPVVAPAKEEKAKMKAVDANKIITRFLSPAWNDAKKKGDSAGMLEANRLANELRIASGQPVQ
ncbi:M23 family metallopeptidase [Paenibacillus sinopodophylli]|uniref:M23 family metallopeptidase n=1 Tax=Paenibacillus sinopodophylli TaxID=1837342 RepID=UPI00110CC966|nr:M23 family metallopeptidase [Paenibacillus sinopodophylli]